MIHDITGYEYVHLEEPEADGEKDKEGDAHQKDQGTEQEHLMGDSKRAETVYGREDEGDTKCDDTEGRIFQDSFLFIAACPQDVFHHPHEDHATDEHYDRVGLPEPSQDDVPFRAYGEIRFREKAQHCAKEEANDDGRMCFPCCDPGSLRQPRFHGGHGKDKSTDTGEFEE